MVSYVEFLCAPLSVLCVSAVSVFKPLFTADDAETAQRRIEFKTLPELVVDQTHFDRVSHQSRHVVDVETIH